jgi:hypothetical protein
VPKREHDTFAWRAAIEALMLDAEHGGDTMLPRFDIMRVPYPGGLAPSWGRERLGVCCSDGLRLPFSLGCRCSPSASR